MTEFYVKVVPDQEERTIDLSGTYPVIHLTASASQGRANTVLVTFLSDVLGTDVGIISGHQSRRKKMVADLPEDDIMNALEHAAGT